MEFPSEPLDFRRQEMVRNIREAMRGGWEGVVKIYEDQTELASQAKITKSGYTALHIAVSDGEEKVVEKLVEILHNKGFREALEDRTKADNTPLHIAASTGNIRMCDCIFRGVGDGRTSMGIKNKDGETPLFLAVLHGKKDAFLYLYSLISNFTGNAEENKEYSRQCMTIRRNDGDTILHTAISREYFDLAFQIIHRCRDLVSFFNEKGYTPLHVLATKPSAFRSGLTLGPWKSLTYQFLPMRPLVPIDISSYGHSLKNSNQPKYPPNYDTFMRFLRFLGNVTGVIATGAKSKTAFSNGRKESTEDSDPEDAILHEGNEGNQLAPVHRVEEEDHQLVPENYQIFCSFANLLNMLILVLTGQGAWITNLLREKEKHRWSVLVLNELLADGKMYDYEDPIAERDFLGAVELGVHEIDDRSETKKVKSLLDDLIGVLKKFVESRGEGKETAQLNEGPEVNEIDSSSGTQTEESFPDELTKQKKNQEEKRETALLIAARNGITEIVRGILKYFPMAIYDVNEEKKNVVLLAVENRQVEVYKLMVEKHSSNESVFRKVDAKGNSALHLAAMKGKNIKPWPIPGDALQMQWEIKWSKFIEKSMPPSFFVRFNENGETPDAIFTSQHEKLVTSGCQWMKSTSEACSVVAALIATVAFATSTALPGGTNENSGKPTLEHQPAFQVFAISSLVALCFSVTSLAMFLAILTSRFQEKDFGTALPWKLLVGLTSLFLSIAAMLVSFCAGHFFVLRDTLKYAAFPVYALTSVPVTFFAAAQFPLYIDLIHATFCSPYGKARRKPDSPN